MGPTKILLAWTSKSSRARPAFTLLELVVVIVVVALVAAVVVMNWTGVHHRSVRESATSRLQSLDQHLRHYSRSRRHVTRLRFEIGTSNIRKLYHESSRDNPAVETLGRSIQVTRIKTSVSGKTGKKVEIPFRVDGSSASYGVELTGPGNTKQWLVFAGVSGEMTRLESESEFDELWQAITQPRL